MREGGVEFGGEPEEPNETLSLGKVLEQLRETNTLFGAKEAEKLIETREG